MHAPRRTWWKSAAAVASCLGAVCLGSGGCGGRADTPAPGAPPSQSLATRTADAVGAPAPPTAGDATETMAAQLGMTPEELAAKKQMLMEAGMSPAEIARELALSGTGLAGDFRDDAESNVEPPDSIGDLIFFRSDSEKKFELREYIGRKNIVLVFTRGYEGGSICPFCATQTAQLAANQARFRELDTVVLIVYPGSLDYLDDFNTAVAEVAKASGGETAERESWPVLLDPDLAAVNLLDIAADLASPSTFIIDKQGNVVFSYVGANRSDRPSVRALLRQLAAIQPTGPPNRTAP